MNGAAKSRVDISPSACKTIQKLLDRYLPETEAWAYGSRAKGTATPKSDLDVVVFATPEQHRQVSDLKEAFEESNLPFRVDLFVWDDVPENFQKNIQAHHVVLQKGKDDGENPVDSGDHSGDLEADQRELEGGGSINFVGKRTTPIQELIDTGILVINDGYRAKNLELGNTGLPFARAGNINNGFQFEDADKFPETNRAKLGEKTSKPGDVVFTSKGTVGRFAFVGNDTPEFVYSPQLCFWRSLDHSKLNPRWLYYWMNGREFFGQFKGVSNQSDMAEYVSLRDQRSMEITLVDPQDQSTISNILGAFDDKIALNRKINETLEGMARALFQSWFVDFDPVKAKLAAKRHGRDLERACMAALSGKLRIAPGKPRAERLEAQLPTADELDAAMAALDTLTEAQRQQLSQTASAFPDDFEDSELGLIPVGWEIGDMNDFSELNSNSWTVRDHPTIVAYVDLANCKNGYILSVQNYDWDSAPSRARRKLTEGDTVFGTVRPGNRSFTLIGKHEQSLTGSTGFAVLSPRKRHFREFVYLHTTSEDNINRLQHLADGAAYPAVRPDIVAQYPIVNPPDATLVEFSRAISENFLLIQENERQAKILAELRDALLPRLLSGELSVRAAEDAIEKVVVS